MGKKFSNYVENVRYHNIKIWMSFAKEFDVLPRFHFACWLH